MVSTSTSSTGRWGSRAASSAPWRPSGRTRSRWPATSSVGVAATTGAAPRSRAARMSGCANRSRSTEPDVAGSPLAARTRWLAACAARDSARPANGTASRSVDPCAAETTVRVTAGSASEPASWRASPSVIGKTPAVAVVAAAGEPASGRAYAGVVAEVARTAAATPRVRAARRRVRVGTRAPLCLIAGSWRRLQKIYIDVAEIINRVRRASGEGSAQASGSPVCSHIDFISSNACSMMRTMASRARSPSRRWIAWATSACSCRACSSG